MNDGGPAFPTESEVWEGNKDGQGMSLRDWFAGMALQGIYSNKYLTDTFCHAEIAKQSYLAADAMIAAREKN